MVAHDAAGNFYCTVCRLRYRLDSQRIALHVRVVFENGEFNSDAAFGHGLIGVGYRRVIDCGDQDDDGALCLSTLFVGDGVA